MSKLEMKKMANDLAYDNVQQPLSAMDTAVSAKATDLKLTDQEYQTFRGDALAARAFYFAAHQADQAAAKRAQSPGQPFPPPAPAAKK